MAYLLNPDNKYAKVLFISYNLLMVFVVVLTVFTAYHYTSFDKTCDECVDKGLCLSPVKITIPNNLTNLTNFSTENETTTLLSNKPLNEVESVKYVYHWRT